jgi:outer membrane protein TolC
MFTAVSLTEVIAVFTALVALIWGAAERRSRVRAADAGVKASEGSYVESLAQAAHDLVITYRTEVTELRVRLSKLEDELEIFGCAVTNCQNRRSLMKSRSK